MTRLQNVVCIGLISLAPAAMAEEFSTTLKPETLEEAQRFEKYKETSADAQARKDAGEQVRPPRQARARAARTMKPSKSETQRRIGQADSSRR